MLGVYNSYLPNSIEADRSAAITGSPAVSSVTWIPFVIPPIHVYSYYYIEPDEDARVCVCMCVERERLDAWISSVIRLM